MTVNSLYKMAAWAVLWQRYDVEESMADIEERLSDGEMPTAAQVRSLRSEINVLLMLTEDGLAEITDGVEPWENPPDVPYAPAKRYYDRDSFQNPGE